MSKMRVDEELEEEPQSRKEMPEVVSRVVVGDDTSIIEIPRESRREVFVGVSDHAKVVEGEQATDRPTREEPDDEGGGTEAKIEPRRLEARRGVGVTGVAATNARAATGLDQSADSDLSAEIGDDGDGVEEEKHGKQCLRQICVDCGPQQDEDRQTHDEDENGLALSALFGATKAPNPQQQGDDEANQNQGEHASIPVLGTHFVHEARISIEHGPDVVEKQEASENHVEWPAVQSRLPVATPDVT